jgi:hypothetical protein
VFLREAVTRACPVLAAYALVFGASDTGEAQRVPCRAQLRLELTNFAVSYGRPAHGQGVVFAGEPLIVELGIANRYEGPRAAAEVDWPHRVSATIRPGGRFDPDVAAQPMTCELQPSRDDKVQMVGDYVVIEPGGYQFFKCPLGVNRLPPGQYTFVIHWSPEAIAPERLSIRSGLEDPLWSLRDVLEFESRQALTRDDQLDRLVHLASHEERSGHFSDGVAFIDQLLSAEPNSTIGWHIRGRLSAQAGRCADAATAYKRASEIITGRLDARTWQLATQERIRTVEYLRDELRRYDCPSP